MRYSIDQAAATRLPAGITKHWVLLGTIVVLGAWVRLSAIDLGWVFLDQVRDGTIALDILGGRNFPLAGPQSRGTTLAGPLYYYLLAVPYSVSVNPAVGVGFQNLLAAVSVYLTYRLGAEMFGPRVGLFAAALYAVFPMAVLSGKTLWNPGFVPILTTTFFLTLWRFLTGHGPWLLTPVLLLLGILLQIHMSGAIFLVLLPITLLIYRPPLSRLPLIAGILCVTLLYVPYIVFEVQHGFADLRRLVSWPTQPGSQPAWVIAARGFWTPFLLPHLMAVALPGSPSPPGFAVAQRLELGLLGIGLMGLGIGLATAPDRRPYVLLALWFVLPFLIISQLRTGIPWYYFDILYPAQFLVIGLLTHVRLLPRPTGPPGLQAQNWARILMTLTVGGIVIVQMWFIKSFETAVERSGILRFPTEIILSFPDPGWKGDTKAVGETIPLRYKRALAQQFVSTFGVDHVRLEPRAHGAIYEQFREDKGFSFVTVSPSERSARFDPSLHYLFLRGATSVAHNETRTPQVGPYRIVAYHPAIRYDSWKLATSPGPDWWTEQFDDSAWTPAILPQRKIPDRAQYYHPIPFARWPGKMVALRGWVEVSAVPRDLWLVVNVRNDLPSSHEVERFYLNGQPIKTSRARSPVISSNGRTSELIADVTPVLRRGLNLVAFQIRGTTEEFDLDIYELWPPPGPAATER